MPATILNHMIHNLSAQNRCGHSVNVWGLVLGNSSKATRQQQQLGNGSKALVNKVLQLGGAQRKQCTNSTAIVLAIRTCCAHLKLGEGGSGVAAVVSGSQERNHGDLAGPQQMQLPALCKGMAAWLLCCTHWQMWRACQQSACYHCAARPGNAWQQPMQVLSDQQTCHTQG